MSNTTTLKEAVRSSTPPAPGTVRVWDPLLRIMHWTLAGGFLVSYLSAEEWTGLHTLSGYVIGATVLLRLLWGVVGPRHARFASFVRGPAAVRAYLLGMLSGNAPRHLGHNPAGGAMTVALLLALALTALSGMQLFAVAHGEGPLARLQPEAAAEARAVRTAEERKAVVDEAAEDRVEARYERFEEVHEIFVNLTLFLIVLHLAGVAASSLRHRENLVRAMIDGRKRAPEGARPSDEPGE